MNSQTEEVILFPTFIGFFSAEYPEKLIAEYDIILWINFPWFKDQLIRCRWYNRHFEKMLDNDVVKQGF